MKYVATPLLWVNLDPFVLAILGGPFVYFIVYHFYRKRSRCKANRVDPNQKSSSETSDLGIYVFRDASPKWFNRDTF